VIKKAVSHRLSASSICRHRFHRFAQIRLGTGACSCLHCGAGGRTQPGASRPRFALRASAFHAAGRRTSRVPPTIPLDSSMPGCSGPSIPVRHGRAGAGNCADGGFLGGGCFRGGTSRRRGGRLRGWEAVWHHSGAARPGSARRKRIAAGWHHSGATRPGRRGGRLRGWEAVWHHSGAARPGSARIKRSGAGWHHSGATRPGRRGGRLRGWEAVGIIPGRHAPALLWRSC